jgi:hypothetical protein
MTSAGSGKSIENGGEGIKQIPREVRRLFWDIEIDELDFSRHEDFIIGRVLSAGGLEDICWLRGLLGNGRIREWILKSEGRSLSKERLRYWELILDLPHDLVTGWLKSEARQVWDGRSRYDLSH